VEDEMGLVCSRNEKRSVYRLLVGKPERRDHWENEDIGFEIILRRILKR
jgi:hypothetical protein